ncbi:MAG: YeiH family protein [Coprococcus sp.]
MNWIKKNWKGLLLCLAIAVPSWFLGKIFTIIGGAVIAIIAGMLITLLIKNKAPFESGIKFTSKKILQWAVILLGFGLNLNVIFETGKQSLPIIVCTIATSLIIAFVLHKVMHIPSRISTLVGVGSSICGGSAIAATAPVIDADDEEVAQAISVIFFFNVLAAILFPSLGNLLGFDRTTGEVFGIFAGTAINDTSSVTAAASTWDSMWNLGSATLDKAVTVKLTRTLAIIPITLVLAFLRTRKEKENAGSRVSFKSIFPFFILYFIAASIITTIAVNLGVSGDVFKPIKELSKFFIVLAMSAIGLNTNIVKLIKTGGKPIFMGACCWVGITAVSLLLQSLMGIW